MEIPGGKTARVRRERGGCRNATTVFVIVGMTVPCDRRVRKRIEAFLFVVPNQRFRKLLKNLGSEKVCNDA